MILCVLRVPKESLFDITTFPFFPPCRLTFGSLHRTIFDRNIEPATRHIECTSPLPAPLHVRILLFPLRPMLELLGYLSSEHSFLRTLSTLYFLLPTLLHPRVPDVTSILRTTLRTQTQLRSSMHILLSLSKQPGRLNHLPIHVAVNLLQPIVVHRISSNTIL